MSGTVKDVRYALRQLRKSPGFTTVAVLTLALGIGVSTGMYGVMNAVLLQPPPFHEPDRIVRILATQGDTIEQPSPLDVRDFAAQNHTFEKMAVYDSGWRKNVSAVPGSTEPEQRPIGLVPAAYFEVLGIKPFIGRLFEENENQWGNHYEAILSYDFWQTRFQGDAAVLGKTIRINDEPYTIIAVMPPGLPGWSFDSVRGPVELWTPFVPYLSPNETSIWDETARRSGAWAIGRLRPGVTIEQAQADLQRIAANLAATHPLDRGVGVVLRPLRDDRIGTLRPVIRLLMGAVLLILLIACSNVANLLLARNSTRAREVAVRVAMGAARTTLIRQFMIESLILGVFGGALGCALAWLSCEVVSHVHPAQLVQLASVRVNSSVLLFALAISIVSSLIFGVIPAWVSSGVNLSDAFKESGRSVAGHGKKWLRQSFVVGEMALAVMLLVATGLLMKSLLRLQNQDPGFRVDHVLRTHLFLPPVRYSSPDLITRFCTEYATRVAQLPGVQGVTISAAYPPDDQWMQYFTIPGKSVSALEDTPQATFNVTDENYLPTLGVPLLRGRNFAASDTETGPPVLLINKSLAERYFPGEDPLGKQLQMSMPSPGSASNLPAGVSANTQTMNFTIVGVTGDTLNRGLALPPEPQLTALFRQTPKFNFGFKNLIVRTALVPLQLAEPIRRQLHSLDPNVPFAEVYSMDQVMQQHTVDRRYTSSLLALFAVFGTALAGIGVYGVVSCVVTQRTGEIGVRMALGAQRADVLWMITQQGLGVAAIGTGIGLVGAWALRRVVAQLVFGISPTDPATFAAAALALITFALCATFIPARRAAKVDPMVALRYE